MTEKRFTRHKSLDGDCTIYDELNDFQFPSLPLGVSKIFCDKLNELAEENNEFKINEEFKNKAYSDLLDNFTRLKKKYQKSKKENKELNSIKCFADNNGINIFNIDEAFRRCWNDN